MDDAVEIINNVLTFKADKRSCALATVVNTWGSAPRRSGAMMCIDADMAFMGSVSGGCVESAVIEQALGVIQSNQPQLLEFGVSDEQAFEVGLACGGNIEIYVQAISEKHIDALEKLISLNRLDKAAVLMFDLGRGTDINVIERDQLNTVQGFDDVEIEGIQQAIRRDKTLIFEHQQSRCFVQPFNPPLNLFIVGAVHIAQQLAPIASQLGFSVNVIDPRTAFANQARFPKSNLITQWPTKVFEDLKLTHRSAVIALTHDPKFDDPALMGALESDAFYIGALGSRKTHAKRIERLAQAGFESKQTKRIHGPVGLDINATNPDEIAVSIAAQLVQALRSE